MMNTAYEETNPNSDAAKAAEREALILATELADEGWAMGWDLGIAPELASQFGLSEELAEAIAEDATATAREALRP